MQQSALLADGHTAQGQDQWGKALCVLLLMVLVDCSLCPAQAKTQAACRTVPENRFLCPRCCFCTACERVLKGQSI